MTSQPKGYFSATQQRKLRKHFYASQKMLRTLASNGNVPQARLRTSATRRNRTEANSILPQASQRSAYHMRPAAVVCLLVFSSIMQQVRNATPNVQQRNTLRVAGK